MNKNVKIKSANIDAGTITYTYKSGDKEMLFTIHFKTGTVTVTDIPGKKKRHESDTAMVEEVMIEANSILEDWRKDV